MRYVTLLAFYLVFLSSPLHPCLVDKQIEEARAALADNIETRKTSLVDYQDSCMFSGDITTRSSRKFDVVCWVCFAAPDIHMIWEDDIASGDETGTSPDSFMVPDCAAIRCANAQDVFATWWWIERAYRFVVEDRESGRSEDEIRIERGNRRIKKACFRKEDKLDVLRTVTDDCQAACYAWKSANKMIEHYSNNIAELLEARDDACAEKLECEGLEGIDLEICECVEGGGTWVDGECKPAGGGGDILPEVKAPITPSYEDQGLVGVDSMGEEDDSVLEEDLMGGSLAHGSADELSGQVRASDGSSDRKAAFSTDGFLSMQIPTGASGARDPRSSRRDTQQKRDSIDLLEVEDYKEELLGMEHEGISTEGESVFDIVYRMHRMRYFAGLLEDTVRPISELEDEGPVGTKPTIYERRMDRTTVR